ncbi:MAG TPA: hypothetical protein VIM11_25595 [Tepidisphaeraceae bacterium]|jgi:hypothetical protein
MIDLLQFRRLRGDMSPPEVVQVLGPPDNETGSLCHKGFSLAYKVRQPGAPRGEPRWWLHFHWKCDADGEPAATGEALLEEWEA